MGGNRSVSVSGGVVVVVVAQGDGANRSASVSGGVVVVVAQGGWRWMVIEASVLVVVLLLCRRGWW
jgi:hypothetical protein